MASTKAVDGRIILEVKEVCLNYGPMPALTGLSLNVKEGEIISLLGANGAGKTTTLNAICGIVPIAKGEILFHGRRIHELTPQKLVNLGIVQVPEGRRIFAPMSVMDNLILGAYHRYGKVKKEVIRQDFDAVFKLFPVLKKQRKRMSGTLSGGEQQMLALARGFTSSPQLLLLDEPSLGLAPMVVSEVMRTIGELRDRGISILLVEQNARAALRIADRGYVMEIGRIVIEGTTEQLLADQRVRVAYLGRNHSEAQGVSLKKERNL